MRIEKLSRDNFNHYHNLLMDFAKSTGFRFDEGHKTRLMSDGLRINSDYTAFLAFVGENPAGFTTVFRGYSSFNAARILWLDDLFVSEKYRNNHVGQELFDYCVRYAVKRNWAAMRWGVDDKNSAAIKFYERNGAKKTEFGYWELGRDLMRWHVKNLKV